MVILVTAGCPLLSSGSRSSMGQAWLAAAIKLVYFHYKNFNWGTMVYTQHFHTHKIITYTNSSHTTWTLNLTWTLNSHIQGHIQWQKWLHPKRRGDEGGRDGVTTRSISNTYTLSTFYPLLHLVQGAHLNKVHPIGLIFSRVGYIESRCVCILLYLPEAYLPLYTQHFSKKQMFS